MYQLFFDVTCQHLHIDTALYVSTKTEDFHTKLLMPHAKYILQNTLKVFVVLRSELTTSLLVHQEAR